MFSKIKHIFIPHARYHIRQKLMMAFGCNIITKNITIHSWASITLLNTSCQLRKKYRNILQSICFQIHIKWIAQHRCLSRNNMHKRSREYMHFLNNPYYRMFWVHHCFLKRWRKWRLERLQNAVCQRRNIPNTYCTWVYIFSSLTEIDRWFL